MSVAVKRAGNGSGLLAGSLPLPVMVFAAALIIAEFFVDAAAQGIAALQAVPLIGGDVCGEHG